jgi:hypothetical protein
MKNSIETEFFKCDDIIIFSGAVMFCTFSSGDGYFISLAASGDEKSLVSHTKLSSITSPHLLDSSKTYQENPFPLQCVSIWLCIHALLYLNVETVNMMLEAVCSKPSHNIRLENEYL